ncbi:MAG TPA: hypothetical protein VIL84_06325 [Devosiaceae bacterium]
MRFLAVLELMGLLLLLSVAVHNAKPAIATIKSLVDLNSPIARADFYVSTLTPQELETRIAKALEENDSELASSLEEIAVEQNIPLPAEMHIQIAAASAFNPLGAGKEFATSFLTGDSSTTAGMVGATISEFLAIGDARTVLVEGTKAVRGDSYDALGLALSAFGVASTAGTVAAVLPTVGASLAVGLPLKSSLSLIKSLRRAGRFSERMSGELTSLAKRTINMTALRDAVSLAEKRDFRKMADPLKRVFEPETFVRVGRMVENTVEIGKNSGVSAARRSLELAENTDELAQYSKLSTAKKGKYLGLLSLAGQKLLRLATNGMVLGLRLGGMLLWSAASLLLAIRIGFKCVKLGRRLIKAG